MDVEKTMEFILEQQARTEASLARSSERHDRTEALLRRAIRAGVTEARKQRVRTAQLDEEMQKLAAAQRETEASLKAFIDSMRRGGNGSH